MSDLLRRLDQDGALGLDMSPGDPTAREAASKIRSLRAEVELLTVERDQANEAGRIHMERCVALRTEVEQLGRLLREGHELMQDCISSKTTETDRANRAERALAELRGKVEAERALMVDRSKNPLADRYVKLNLEWHAQRLAAILAEPKP